MSLLQGGSMEIFICSSSTMYDQMSNKLTNVVSKDRNIKGKDSSNIQLDILRLIWSEDVFEKTISFLKSMCELKLDEATLILFVPLILFSPDRRNIQETAKILDIQSKYALLLKKYMLWKYGHKQETIVLYDKLLLKLIELRTLHEMHSSILLEADPAHLDPFPLALLMNEKTDLAKLNHPAAQDSTAQQSATDSSSNQETNEEISLRTSPDSTGSNSCDVASNTSSHNIGSEQNSSILTPASNVSSNQYSSMLSSTSPTSQQQFYQTVASVTSNDGSESSYDLN